MHNVNYYENKRRGTGDFEQVFIIFAFYTVIMLY